MTTRHLSRFVVALVTLTFTVLLLCGSITSAGRGDKTSPTTPTNLRVTALTETTVTFAWNAASDNSGKFSYKLQMTSLNNSAYNSLATISQAQTTYTAKYLSSNSQYSFTLYAVDDAGNRSGNSNNVNVTTPTDTTPPSKPFLEASVLAPSQVQLTWTKSTDNVAYNCCAYGVNVNGTPFAGHINWVIAPSADKLSAVIRHLTPGATYSFNVSASDYSGGNTATSNTVVATTQPSSDNTPPLVPANLHLVSENGCAEVYLGWDQTTDSNDGQAAIEYEIYVNDILSPLPVSAGVNIDFVYGTAFGDNIFYIKAVDRSGNSSAPSQAIKLPLWPC